MLERLLPRRAAAAVARAALAMSIAASIVGVGRAGAQQPNGGAAASVARGLDFEQGGKLREAAAAYREGLRGQELVGAMLGLERVYTALGWTDTLRVMLDSLARAVPRNPSVRSAQIRALRAEGRDAQARAAFESWVRDVPGDAHPYREYARLLIGAGQAAAADSILSRAASTLGARASGVSLEIAQARSALGLWEPAAQSWRAALDEAGYLVPAAVFALQPAPADARPAIARALGAAPPRLGSRQALAQLQLAWGSPREAWTALRDLPPSDSAAVAWREFADVAEASTSWLVARDALLAAAGAARRGGGGVLVARAAADALNGGDAAGALTIAGSVTPAPGDTAASLALIAVKVRALSSLGRAAEADALVQQSGASLDEGRRAELRRGVVWGWIKAGDVAKARAALASAGGDADEGALGWLSLYEGDLAAARTKLTHAGDATADLVTARALLARSRAERSTAAGNAFLALARGDTARAAAQFVDAGRELPDAAPLLLAVAARLHVARHDDASAVPLWSSIVNQYATAPEAAEADLEWGRALRRKGDAPGAVARFEHLILTYPQSALVPQARREMERAKGQTAS
ncbi:MAG TPA: hypothetical protein VFJ74_01235 [Gemmatimonadaceae bacterium]|nr:hypothetical protein [Gemmatimonadaceae bacterium]